MGYHCHSLYYTATEARKLNFVLMLQARHTTMSIERFIRIETLQLFIYLYGNRKRELASNWNDDIVCRKKPQIIYWTNTSWNSEQPLVIATFERGSEWTGLDFFKAKFNKDSKVPEQDTLMVVKKYLTSGARFVNTWLLQYFPIYDRLLTRTIAKIFFSRHLVELLNIFLWALHLLRLLWPRCRNLVDFG